MDIVTLIFIGFMVACGVVMLVAFILMKKEEALWDNKLRNKLKEENFVPDVEFIPNSTSDNGLLLDSKSRRLAVVSTKRDEDPELSIFSYKQILDIKLIDSTKRHVNSLLGRKIAGGLLAGPIGIAIAGASREETGIMGEVGISIEAIDYQEKTIEYKFLTFKNTVENAVDIGSRYSEGKRELDRLYKSISDHNESFIIDNDILNATYNESIDTIKDLIKKGINLDKKDLLGDTPLHHACISRKNLDIAKLLIYSGADVNCKDHFGNNILSYLNDSDREIAKLIIDNGANVNERNMFGFTPLAIAVSEKNYDLSKILIEHGADVDSRANDDTPILVYAIQNNEINFIKLLLESGANTNFRYMNYSARQYARYLERREIARIIRDFEKNNYYY